MRWLYSIATSRTAVPASSRPSFPWFSCSRNSIGDVCNSASDSSSRQLLGCKSWLLTLIGLCCLAESCFSWLLTSFSSFALQDGEKEGKPNFWVNSPGVNLSLRTSGATCQLCLEEVNLSSDNFSSITFAKNYFYHLTGSVSISALHNNRKQQQRHSPHSTGNVNKNSDSYYTYHEWLK